MKFTVPAILRFGGPSHRILLTALLCLTAARPAGRLWRRERCGCRDYADGNPGTGSDAPARGHRCADGDTGTNSDARACGHYCADGNTGTNSVALTCGHRRADADTGTGGGARVYSGPGADYPVRRRGVQRRAEFGDPLAGPV